MNKMIEGKQMTICFHLDDCKLSHRKSKVMDKMIEWLRQEYESIFEDGSGQMMVSRGKVHKYRGMTLDYTIRGQVKITGVIPARDPGPGKTKKVRFELATHKVKAKVEPTKGKKSTRKSLVPPGARNHRSVLEVVANRTKDGHRKTGRASENLG
jgi:hypothetical protein